MKYYIYIYNYIGIINKMLYKYNGWSNCNLTQRNNKIMKE